MFRDLLAQGGLSLDRLQNFCKVAEAGGVTKAAEGDPARQSLYSRQIKELEEFFGAELLRRKGRGIALTAAGERLHLMAREQLLALSDFKQACSGIDVELVLAAGESLIHWWLLPRLGALREHLPQASFRVLNLPSREIAERLRQGTVDLGLVRPNTAPRPLKTASLGTMKFCFFAPAALLPTGNPKPWKAWAMERLPFATLEGKGEFRQKLERLCRQQKLALNWQLQLPSFPLVARAVQTGKFAAILPSIAAEELVGQGVVGLDQTFLRALDRETALAWNPRLVRVRTGLEKAIPVFRALCRLD